MRRFRRDRRRDLSALFANDVEATAFVRFANIWARRGNVQDCTLTLLPVAVVTTQRIDSIALAALGAQNALTGRHNID